MCKTVDQYVKKLTLSIIFFSKITLLLCELLLCFNGIVFLVSRKKFRTKRPNSLACRPLRLRPPPRPMNSPVRTVQARRINGRSAVSVISTPFMASRQRKSRTKCKMVRNYIKDYCLLFRLLFIF